MIKTFKSDDESLYTVITNLVRDEHTQVVDGRSKNENSMLSSIHRRRKFKLVRHLLIDNINENISN